MKKYFPLFLSLLIISCSSSDDNFDNCDSDIAFVKEGNKFIYDLDVIGSNPLELSLEVGACTSKGIEITRTLSSSIEKVATTDLWRQENDFLLVNADNGQDYWSKSYKKNVNIGDIWTHKKEDGTTVTHKVVNIDTLITVPAGTFKCNVYEFTTNRGIGESLIYWNDLVGNIKEEGLFLDLILKDYVLSND